MKTITPLFIIILTVAGFTLFASERTGCCESRRHGVAAATNAPDKVTTLRIEGMTCGACATAVRQVLKNVDGVKGARVSYEDKNAVVTYDPARVTPDKIVRAIAEKLPAYKATVIK